MNLKEFFQDTPVLVTGATGFVGTHLVNRLVELGASVRVLVRPSSNKSRVASFEAKGVRVCWGDVCERESVSSATQGVAYVFHIAALFRQAKYPDDIYYQVNVEGTRNVLDAAQACAVKRFVHCSTVGVHSHIPQPPADETEAYRPGDIYQETKCEGEKLANKYFTSGEVPGVIVRPAMIWGEGDKRMLKLFKGVAGRKLPIIGSGQTLTHWVYVHDLVSGMLLAAVSPNAIGQTYILAGKTPVTIEKLYQLIASNAGVSVFPLKIPAKPIQWLGSLVELFCKPLGIEPPIYRRRVDFYTKDRCFSIKKASGELGYEPAQELDKEVQNIYRWYEEQGWLNEKAA